MQRTKIVTVWHHAHANGPATGFVRVGVSARKQVSDRRLVVRQDIRDGYGGAAGLVAWRR